MFGFLSVGYRPSTARGLDLSGLMLNQSDLLQPLQPTVHGWLAGLSDVTNQFGLGRWLLEQLEQY